MFRELAQTLIQLFNMIGSSAIAANNLAEAASLRTSVVRHKSRNAAALSQLRGDTEFIREFAELKTANEALDPKAKKEAESYLSSFE
jgi:hypothetical protein